MYQKSHEHDYKTIKLYQTKGKKKPLNDMIIAMNTPKNHYLYLSSYNLFFYVSCFNYLRYLEKNIWKT